MVRLYKSLNTITALGSLINGVFYLVAPGFSLLLLGQTTNSIGLMNTRVAGAIALGICVINWASREVTEEHHRRVVALGNVIMFSALVLIEIHGTMTGAMSWIGWLYVVADSLLALGYGLYLVLLYWSKK